MARIQVEPAKSTTLPIVAFLLAACISLLPYGRGLAQINPSAERTYFADLRGGFDTIGSGVATLVLDEQNMLVIHVEYGNLSSPLKGASINMGGYCFSPIGAPLFSLVPPAPPMSPIEVVIGPLTEPQIESLSYGWSIILQTTGHPQGEIDGVICPGSEMRGRFQFTAACIADCMGIGGFFYPCSGDPGLLVSSYALDLEPWDGQEVHCFGYLFTCCSFAGSCTSFVVREIMVDACEANAVSPSTWGAIKAHW